MTLDLGFPQVFIFMTDREIQNGSYGWYEKGAMQKIEDLPFRQQAGCKLVYIALCSTSAEQKNSSRIECYKWKLAKFASVSEKTIARHLKSMEDLGVIKVSPQDRKSNGRFEKVKIWLVVNIPTVGHFVESSQKVVGKFDAQLTCNINKEIKKESNKQSADESFEIFWNLYPNKKSKQTAIKSWSKLSLSEKSLAIEKLPDHLKSQQWVKDGGQFVPHPSSWLNQKRWLDEIKNLTPIIYAA